MRPPFHPPLAERAERLRTGRQIVAQLLRRIFIAAVLAAAILYAGDYLQLRYRIARNGNPYGTVTVRPYYAVPQKDHKTEFLFDDAHDQTCVNALFPHLGDSACWYLRRNPDKRVDM